MVKFRSVRRCRVQAPGAQGGLRNLAKQPYRFISRGAATQENRWATAAGSCPNISYPLFTGFRNSLNIFQIWIKITLTSNNLYINILQTN